MIARPLPSWALHPELLFYILGNFCLSPLVSQTMTLKCFGDLVNIFISVVKEIDLGHKTNFFRLVQFLKFYFTGKSWLIP